MNIRGIGSNNVINLYVNNKSKSENPIREAKGDSIEISDLAKSLRNFDFDTPSIKDDKKIQEIKEKIEMGTYNVDARLTAQSLLDSIKERGI